MNTAAKHFFEFGAFRLDASERLLLHRGETVSLTPKAFDMLVTLVENSGHLVEKSELMRRLWPDSFVEEGSLAQNVSLLRKALGENETQKFIETVPRRGYRFVATVVSKTGRVAESTIRSIAVLPFKSLGVDEGDEYLSIGIAETLTTRLSSLKLLVVRTTSAVLKHAGSEKDALEIGQKLQVDTVLEGSIRRAGERLRVTARLVSVSDEAVLWADKFDEQFTDIFEVEDSISAKVAQALALKVSGEEQKRLTKRYTNNPEAYQLYLKGRYFWNKRTEEGFNQGIAQFQLAVAKDSTYALAYAGLADSYIGLTFYNFGAPHQTMPKAKEAAMNALSIDSALAEAHTSLAHVLMNYDWNWPEAEKEFKLSIQLNPDYATAHQWYAIHYLTATDQMETALEEMKRALQLEPTSLVMNSFMGATLYFAGRYDEAIEQCRWTIEMDPNFAVAHWHLGLAYEQKEMFDEAIAEFQKATTLSGGSPLLKASLGHAYAKANRIVEATKIMAELNELSQQRYVSSYERAAMSVALDDEKQAFEFLERAYEEHSFHLVYLKVWPQFNRVRNDPRFQDLMQRLGLSHISAVASQ
jgi:TolB-like protein/Tfp pilus assembly protein PilF